MPFPSNPTVDQQYTFSGRVYIWTGKVWNIFSNGGTAADQDLNTTDDVQFNSVMFPDGSILRSANFDGGNAVGVGFNVLDGGDATTVGSGAIDGGCC